jgi:hypothetical protein
MRILYVAQMIDRLLTYSTLYRIRLHIYGNLTSAFKVVKIKSSLATTVKDINYVLITIATCLGLFNGHPQAIITILNIKINVTITTREPLCIAKSNCMYCRQRLPSSMFRVNFQI